MKKSKLLTPILAIGTLGAIVTPMSILTSCNKGVNTGKNANLVHDYVCSVKAADKATYTKETDALTAYLNAVAPKTNDEEYEILKDDARFAYSLGFKTDNFKKLINGKYDSYTLDFDNVKIVNTDDTKTMDVTFVIKFVNGAFETDKLKVSNANLECKFRMDKPFNLAFHKADDTVTYEKRNYISCTPVSADATATYYLSGTCIVDGKEYTFNNEKQTTSLADDPTSGDPAQICGYMVKEFVLTGLACNYRDVQTMANEGGCLYSNYMANAEIKAE